MVRRTEQRPRGQQIVPTEVLRHYFHQVLLVLAELERWQAFPIVVRRCFAAVSRNPERLALVATPRKIEHPDFPSSLVELRE
jgi:hypothetical protein